MGFLPKGPNPHIGSPCSNNHHHHPCQQRRTTTIRYEFASAATAAKKEPSKPHTHQKNKEGTERDFDFKCPNNYMSIWKYICSSPIVTSNLGDFYSTNYPC